MTRNSRLIIISILVMILLGIGFVCWVFMRQHSEGPLFKSGVGNSSHWIANGIPGKSGQLVVLGGFPFRNITKSSISITKIELTNVPKGLQVISIGVLQLPPQLTGAYLNMNENMHNKFLLSNLTTNKIQSLPIKLSSGGDYWEPVIVVKADSFGLYTIKGLIISYRVDGLAYKDYFPDELYLCVNTNLSCQSAQVSPPPTKWPD